MVSFGIDTGPLIICCSNSAQKSAVQVCQIANVVMETTQLVLNRFKNFLLQSAVN